MAAKTKAEYWQKYQQAHRVELSQKARKRYHSDPEHARNLQTVYGKLHPERIAEYKQRPEVKKQAALRVKELRAKKKDDIEWNEKHRVKYRAAHLKRLYKLSVAEYDAILIKQNGLCAICREAETQPRHPSGRLCVDHDHKSGKVRALLCGRCNRSLGHYHTPDLLRKMADYVEEHQ
jgi:hypothetical protein